MKTPFPRLKGYLFIIGEAIVPKLFRKRFR